MNSMHQLSSLSESGSIGRSGGSSVLAAAIALALGVPPTVRAADAPGQLQRLIDTQKRIESLVLQSPVASGQAS